MKLGTVVYNEKIYNLDYMTSRQIKNLLKKIRQSQEELYNEGVKIILREDTKE